MAGGSDRAALVGGPMDGQLVDVEEDANELTVTMADRTIHRYLRAAAPEVTPATDAVAVFQWQGRTTS